MQMGQLLPRSDTECTFHPYHMCWQQTQQERPVNTAYMVPLSTVGHFGFLVILMNGVLQASISCSGPNTPVQLAISQQLQRWVCSPRALNLKALLCTLQDPE